MSDWDKCRHGRVGLCSECGTMPVCEECDSLGGQLAFAQKEAATFKHEFKMLQGGADRLLKENAELRAWATEAREALEFYAAKENYESLDVSHTTKNRVFDIVLFDFDRNLMSKKDYAGRRARKALSQSPGRLKEIAEATEELQYRVQQALHNWECERGGTCGPCDNNWVIHNELKDALEALKRVEGGG